VAARSRAQSGGAKLFLFPQFHDKDENNFAQDAVLHTPDRYVELSVLVQLPALPEIKLRDEWSTKSIPPVV